MDEETPIEFETYQCSLGTVVGYDGNSYIITTPDGYTIGTPANTTPSAENVEADIVSPPPYPKSDAQIWEEWLAGFVHDDVTGINLKVNLAACNRFCALEALLGSALEHGALTPESPISVWDKDNVAHELTVAECRLMLLRYGVAWQTGFANFAP